MRVRVTPSAHPLLQPLPLACVELREEEVGDEEVEEDGEGKHVDHDRAHLPRAAVVGVPMGRP